MTKEYTHLDELFSDPLLQIGDYTMTTQNPQDDTKMYIVEASFDPLGGLNKQKWVGLSYDQAKSVRKKFDKECWGYVHMYSDCPIVP